MCDGAFSSPASTCCQRQPSSTIFSSASSKSRAPRVGVLVDGHPGRRVRHVDERGGGTVRVRRRVAHELGDVDELRPPLGAEVSSLHAGILRAGAGDARTDRELGRLQRAGRPLHRRARRGVLPPLRGAEGHPRARADLRALRRADTPRDGAHALGEAVDGDRRVRELWQFACEGYLGEPHARLRRAGGRARGELEATVDGETIPYRMLRPAIANEPDRDRRARGSRRPATASATST